MYFSRYSSVLFPVRLDALSRHRLPKKLGNLSHAKTTELTEKRRDAALATTDKSHASSLRSLRGKNEEIFSNNNGSKQQRRKDILCVATSRRVKKNTSVANNIL